MSGPPSNSYARAEGDNDSTVDVNNSEAVISRLRAQGTSKSRALPVSEINVSGRSRSLRSESTLSSEVQPQQPKINSVAAPLIRSSSEGAETRPASKPTPSDKRPPRGQKRQASLQEEASMTKNGVPLFTPSDAKPTLGGVNPQTWNDFASVIPAGAAPQATELYRFLETRSSSNTKHPSKKQKKRK
ncbi:hypothetical protein T440DRAFT_476563 [Plenodomus tracheiphilus IPT5]|uniref:Uncharacterized protein n=1 Tax=Plenodomus tracheiphilus IPT5 TaxID=1408161 RepID=A0A6A7BHS8_9PLEO|nr:hypothetical protein T440DRAFT_476563 [Plenodomus tracheiphilus IPT5]